MKIFILHMHFSDFFSSVCCIAFLSIVLIFALKRGFIDSFKKKKKKKEKDRCTK